MINLLVSSSKFGNDMNSQEFFYMIGMLLFMFFLSMALEKVDKSRRAVVLSLLFFIQLLLSISMFGYKFAFFELFPFALLFLLIFIIYLVTNKKIIKINKY